MEFDERRPRSEETCLCFQEDHLLLREFQQGVCLPKVEELRASFPQLAAPLLERFTWGDARYQLHECLESFSPPPGWRWSRLRQLTSSLPTELFALTATAFQLLHWRQTRRYCGRCGSPTVRASVERSLRCTTCGQDHFPHLAPAVILLITRGEKLLLVRSLRHPPQLWSLVAGFVEAGESLEQAAHREALEETGLELENLSYCYSQAWPFPSSLMVAFSANCRGGKLRPGPDEIVEAAWFLPDRLPTTPTGLSIAGRLIADYLQRSHRRTHE